MKVEHILNTFERAIYHNSKRFCACVGTCACNSTPLLKVYASIKSVDGVQSIVIGTMRVELGEKLLPFG